MGAEKGGGSAREGLLDAIRILEEMLADAPGEIGDLAERIARAVEAGGRVYLFGNGGSAADAQHIACELVGRLRGERKAIPATALSTDTSVLTAVGNDRGFEAIFVRQVEAHVRDGDVVIGISTSGSDSQRSQHAGGTVLQRFGQQSDSRIHRLWRTGRLHRPVLARV